MIAARHYSYIGEIGRHGLIGGRLFKAQTLFCPAHAPADQPTKLEATSGVAISVTAVPGPSLPVQSAPQLMPAGALSVSPAPLPGLATFKVAAWTGRITTQAAH